MVKESDLIVSLISRIRDKANRFLLQELRAQGLTDLAPSHGDILGALILFGQLRMTEIAGLLDRQKSTVTVLIDKLVAQGYVEKRQDPLDQRSYLVSLKEETGDLKKVLVNISKQLNSRVVKNISPREKEQLVGILRKINDGW